MQHRGVAVHAVEGGNYGSDTWHVESGYPRLPKSVPHCGRHSWLLKIRRSVVFASRAHAHSGVKHRY